MFKLIKIKNQKGVTLVELLAILVIASFLSVFLYKITVQSMEHSSNIQIETNIRDEADLIVSSFIKTIYSTKQTNIVRNVTTSDSSYIEISSDISKCPVKNDSTYTVTDECKATLKPIGFITKNGVTSFHLLDNVYAINNKNIDILSSSKIIGEPHKTSNYMISLDLTSKKSRFSSTLNFKNEVQAIK